jgi:hypothetical protein
MMLVLVRFAHFRGTLDVEGVRDFINGVLNGRIPTAPVFSAPVVGDAGACLATGER